MSIDVEKWVKNEGLVTLTPIYNTNNRPLTLREIDIYCQEFPSRLIKVLSELKLYL